MRKAMYIKQFKIKGNNINEIINLISEDLITISFNPAEKVHVFISEKYYLRTNSQLMACLIIKIEDEYNAIIDVVTGGGASGMLDLDLGAEGSRSKGIEDILKKIAEIKSWDLIETK